MHLKDIVTAILRGGYDKQTNRAKLYSNLYTTMSRRKASVFKKIEGKPAMFGLVESREEYPLLTKKEPDAAETASGSP